MQSAGIWRKQQLLGENFKSVEEKKFNHDFHADSSGSLAASEVESEHSAPHQSESAEQSESDLDFDSN